MKHICHQDTYDKLEWFSNKAENRMTPGITWLNLSKSYRIIDLSDRLIALTYLKNPWNRWTASSTCHNHDNADVQFKQCKNYKINIQFILLQLKILTSVIIHVCNIWCVMAPVNRSSSSLYSNVDILEKFTEKKQKRKLSFGSTPNAHA